MKRERGNKGGGGQAQSKSGIGFHCRSATPPMFSRVASPANNQHHVEIVLCEEEEAETASFFFFISFK